MCLNTVQPNKELKYRQKGKNKITEGYKIFEEVDEKLYGLYKTKRSSFGSGYKTGKWIRDNKGRAIVAHDGEVYKSGFHFFLKKEDASDFAKNIFYTPHLTGSIEVYKILVKKVVAIGTDVYLPAAVCRKMKILNKV